MVSQGDRWSCASILLTILLIHSTWAKEESAAITVDPVASGTNIVYGLASSFKDNANSVEESRRTDLNDSLKLTESTNENNVVQVKLSDIQNVVLEYLDKNLPPLAENGTNSQQNGTSEAGMQRSFRGSQLVSRLKKFSDRYIHPNIANAVSATGRVFLLKGNVQRRLMLKWKVNQGGESSL